MAVVKLPMKAAKSIAPSTTVKQAKTCRAKRVADAESGDVGVRQRRDARRRGSERAAA